MSHKLPQNSLQSCLHFASQNKSKSFSLEYQTSLIYYISSPKSTSQSQVKSWASFIFASLFFCTIVTPSTYLFISVTCTNTPRETWYAVCVLVWHCLVHAGYTDISLCPWLAVCLILIVHLSGHKPWNHLQHYNKQILAIFIASFILSMGCD